MRRIFRTLIFVVLGLSIGTNVVLYHQLQQLVVDNTQLHTEVTRINRLFALTLSIDNATITYELVTTQNVSYWSGNGISGLSILWCDLYCIASHATLELEVHLAGYPNKGTLLLEVGQYRDLQPWYAVNNTLVLNETQSLETVNYLQEPLTKSGTSQYHQQLGACGWYFISIHQIDTGGNFEIPVTITARLKQGAEYLPFLQLPSILILSTRQPSPSFDCGEWVPIITFNGSTSRTTDVFTVSHRTFRTRYSFSGGPWARFHYYVYPEGGEDGCRVIPSNSSMAGSEIHDGPGTFFIKTFAGGTEDWVVTVEAFIPCD